jgi:hypothetical protein
MSAAVAVAVWDVVPVATLRAEARSGDIGHGWGMVRALVQSIVDR